MPFAAVQLVKCAACCFVTQRWQFMMRMHAGIEQWAARRTSLSIMHVAGLFKVPGHDQIDLANRLQRLLWQWAHDLHWQHPRGCHYDPRDPYFATVGGVQ